MKCKVVWNNVVLITLHYQTIKVINSIRNSVISDSTFQSITVETFVDQFFIYSSI